MATEQKTKLTTYIHVRCKGTQEEAEMECKDCGKKFYGCKLNKEHEFYCPYYKRSVKILASCEEYDVYGKKEEIVKVS